MTSTVQSMTHRRLHLQLLTTLDSANVRPADRLDFSRRLHPAVGTSGEIINLRFKYRQSFPDQTTGFLYYHRPPQHLPPTAGEIRFRLADSPQSFPAAPDLTLPHGLPWCIPIYRLQPPLQDLLLKDNLVSPHLIHHCANIFPEELKHPSFFAFHNVIHHLNQPFPIKLVHEQRLTLWIVGKTAVTPVKFCYVLTKPPSGLSPHQIHNKSASWTTPLFAHLRLGYPGYPHPFQTNLVSIYDPTNHILHPLTSRPKNLRYFLPKSATDLGTATLRRLLREPDSQPTATGSESKRIRGPYVSGISTLDPNRLVPSDCIDVSADSPRTLSIWARDFFSVKMLFRRHRLRPAFPQGTHGFLYYHSPPSEPPTAGEIRFRVVPDGDPAHFVNGIDLARDDSIYPWRLPIWKLVWREKYEPLRALLLRDGLVTNDVLERTRRLFPETWVHRMRMHVLHAFNQPFRIPLGVAQMSVWVPNHEDGPQFFTMPLTIAQPLNGQQPLPPYLEDTRGYLTVCLRYDASGLPSKRGNQDPSGLPWYSSKRVHVELLDVPDRLSHIIIRNVGSTIPLHSHDAPRTSTVLRPLIRQLGYGDD